MMRKDSKKISKTRNAKDKYEKPKLFKYRMVDVASALVAGQIEPL
ncbi:MAG: hypothetical protein ABIE81_07050 [Candidatus Omnitrophota bacterium]